MKRSHVLPEPVPGDALDQLEREDHALRAIFDRIETVPDASQRGQAIQLFVEHLAIRQASREQVAGALTGHPGLGDLSQAMSERTADRRAELSELHELTHGVTTLDLNRVPTLGAALHRVAASLWDEIRYEIDELIPAVRSRTNLTRQELPSAAYVARRARLHPRADAPLAPRRPALGRRVATIYDWVRRLPPSGQSREPEWLEDELRRRMSA
jgi:hypothetical protein